jgi:hypothetical protein
MVCVTLFLLVQTCTVHTKYERLFDEISSYRSIIKGPHRFQTCVTWQAATLKTNLNVCTHIISMQFYDTPSFRLGDCSFVLMHEHWQNFT